jgi:hypothetical protein
VCGVSYAYAVRRRAAGRPTVVGAPVAALPRTACGDRVVAACLPPKVIDMLAVVHLLQLLVLSSSPLTQQQPLQPQVLPQAEQVFPLGMLGFTSFRGVVLVQSPTHLLAFSTGRCSGTPACRGDISSRSVVVRTSASGERGTWAPPRIIANVSQQTLLAKDGLYLGTGTYDSTSGEVLLFWGECLEKCHPGMGGQGVMTAPTFMLAASKDNFQTWTHTNQTERAVADNATVDPEAFLPYNWFDNAAVVLPSASVSEPTGTGGLSGPTSWPGTGGGLVLVGSTRHFNKTGRPPPKCAEIVCNRVGAVTFWSGDHGRTLQRRGLELSPPPAPASEFVKIDEPQLALLPNGSLLMVGHGDALGPGRNTLALALSHDHGLSFVGLRKISGLVQPGCGIGLLVHGGTIYISHDNNGTLATAAPNAHDAARNNLTVSHSTDMGATFTSRPIDHRFTGLSALAAVKTRQGDLLGVLYEGGPKRFDGDGVWFATLPLIKAAVADDAAAAAATSPGVIHTSDSQSHISDNQSHKSDDEVAAEPSGIARAVTVTTIPRGPTNNSDLMTIVFSHTYKKYKTPEAGALGCQAECDADPRCASWTYVPTGTPNGEERCCMSAFRGCPVRRAGCISGAKLKGPCQLPPAPGPSPPLPGINRSWVFHTSTQLPYCHQGFVARVGEGLLTVWQAANVSSEGAPGQWIFGATSSITLPPAPLAWTPLVPPAAAAAGGGGGGGRYQLAGDGVHPAWAPIVFEDPDSPQRVWLIYGEGAPHRSGGSSYSKLSTDGGRSFSANRSVVVTEALWGGVVKASMDQIRVSPNGKTWLLVFSSLKYGQLGAHSDQQAVDPGLAATGVLSSTDRGTSWSVLPGIITDIANVSHFQEPTLEFCSATRLLILFRTTVGSIYKATSTDRGVSWSASVPSTLPNPNSRVNLLRRNGSAELLLAYNPSTTSRQPLSLARSSDCGESWEHVETLYAGHGGYPTMAQVGDDFLVTTFTRDGKLLSEHGGIGAVTTRLPPPLSMMQYDARGVPPDAPLAGIEHRPQYHLLSQAPFAGWVSDPNGPLFANGRYHMFCELDPISTCTAVYCAGGVHHDPSACSRRSGSHHRADEGAPYTLPHTGPD